MKNNYRYKQNRTSVHENGAITTYSKSLKTHWNVSSDSLLIFGAEVVAQGKHSLTLSWQRREVASNIRSIATSATWISTYGNISPKSPEFGYTGIIGRMTGIPSGDVGTVCLKTQVFDMVGELGNILIFIKDIRIGK